MGGSRFVYDYRGVGEFMRRDADLAAGVRARAELAVAFARSIAPIGSPAQSDEHPGAYRDSLQVTGPYVGRDRVRFHLGSDIDYAVTVEAGHQVLARTVAAFGDPRGGEGL